MNNPEDQNPMLPNLRDDSIERMMRLVFLWFFGLAIATLLVIAFLFINSVHKKNLERVGKEYAIQKLDPPVDWSQHTNVYLDGDIDFSSAGDIAITAEMTYSTLRLFSPDGEPWLETSNTNQFNNWHWTNVVFSSTREPVVTKTNGEWRIGFK